MAVRAYLVHLRLPFQFLLSPVFLWGYLLASGKPSLTLLLAYLSFHLFGYAGGTALNSSYDRDDGPIGGLEAPPPVPPHLLAFSILWQALGLVVALAVNLSFASIYFVMFWLSIAYSHPRTRFKGKPLPALATVAVGQGLLAFLGGWSAARGDVTSALNLNAALGSVTAVLLVVGLYPLTESYQLDQDAARGDITLAGFLGLRGSFRFSLGCVLLGGLGAVLIAATRFSALEAIVVVALVGVLAIWIKMWGTRFERQTVLENYHTIMRLYAATTLPFLAWITFHLFIGR